MRKVFLLFFTIFLTIYSSLHFYILGRLFVWSGQELNVAYFSAVAILTLSFFFANMLEQRYSHWSTNLIYMIAATWMGVVAIVFVGVLLGEIAVHFFSRKVVVIGVLLFTLVFTVAGLVHAQRPRLRKYTVQGEANITFGLLTDIHLGPIHGVAYAKKIVERFKKEKIDALLLCGDVIDGPGELSPDILKPFDKLGKPVYMTWGNHEHYLGEERIAKVLQSTKIIPLRNKQTSLKGATIIGIDDAEDKKQVAKMLPKFTPRGFTVLMYHRPDGLEDAAKHGVDLMVSGHTHKGQVFPFSLLVKTRFPRIAGWYKCGKTKLYVSTGAGTWGPPLRFGSRSEMVVIRVQKN